MEPKFMISEILKTSWRSVKSQIWVLAGLLIGFTIISMIISIFTMPAQSSTTGLVVVNLISLLISYLFILGYLKNIFQSLDGEEPQFSAYGQQSRKILTFLIAGILYSVIILLGFALLIVPGIYLVLRLQFFSAFIVEEDAGIIESLQRSWNITEGQVLPLLLLALAMLGVCLLGAILFIIGIFVAIPLIYTMSCYAFRKLNVVSIKETEAYS